MPEHLRALLVVLVAATAVFAFARAPLCSAGVDSRDFDRRRNLWYAVTVAAFVAHDFWLFAGIAAVAVLIAARSEKNVTALFLGVLFAVPMIEKDVPGLGMFQYLFELNYVRLLSLLLLLPAAVALRASGRALPIGAHPADGFLLAFLVVRFFVQLPEDTLTNTIRWSVFYGATDVFLPYYVASRAIKSRRHALEALLCLALAGAVLAATAVFEAGKGWLLYAELINQLGASWGYGKYLGRGDALRALATTGQPIALGYVLVIALGAMLIVRPDIKTQPVRGWLLVLLIAVGLVAALSRGPWLGAVLLLVAFVALGSKPAQGLTTLLVCGVLFLVAVAISPWGGKIVDYLPFVGHVDEENVTYRSELIESSIVLIQANPLFGSFHFMDGLEHMRQGHQGIIDVVNTYIGVALGNGLVGLALFIAALSAPLLSVLALARSDAATMRLRAGLAAMQIASLFIIFTTSSVTVIPFVYWTVLGLTVAMCRADPAAWRLDGEPVHASPTPA